MAEIGAGSSFFTTRIAEVNPRSIFFCIDIGYEDDYTKGNIHYKKYLDEKVDAMLMIDVLEHIENQSIFLEYYGNFLKSGDYLYITVPAFNFLWSNHDVYLKHYRRYTKKALRSVLEKSNFDVIEISYIFNLILPLVFIYRKILKLNGSKIDSDMQQLPAIFNFVLKFLCRMDNFLPFKKFFGLSVISVCRIK